MLSGLKSLFTKDVPADDRLIERTPEVTNAFQKDPMLVATLKAQHKSLVERILAVKKYAQAGDIKNAHAELARFSKGLNAHLYLESTRFYTAFSRVADDTEAKEIAYQMSQEMKIISRRVRDWLNYYVDPWSIEQNKIFLEEIQSKIIAPLGIRIANEEENLYPLYENL